MTTCVVVRKNDQVAIAADSLVTFGDTRLAHGYEANRKIFQVGESYITLAGTAAHFPVMRKLLTDMGEECRLGSRDEVFATFTRAHQILKETYFLNTKEDEDDPYESSQIISLIANPHGIFGIYSYREVFSFDRFWGIGSGRNFALGAMYAVYDSALDARAIAEVGVQAGAEFDKSSSAPFQIISFDLLPAPGSASEQSAEDGKSGSLMKDNSQPSATSITGATDPTQFSTGTTQFNTERNT